ncbi:DNA mismatch repair endonuclease MutL [Thalassotalea sp. LPB0316]|uniref:DNA mismatch repair endonuclease MutL n=1 Tax=Thalassotalea sp. LPB0316 TaxID=2769490 RepID=UPI0018679AAF|nr:DNA mismatch repair endonuclease MutL [Thalassotalea sp. LPB0316]QOL26532.1 DNA mismatch repair endonuclease MutL [Thalassotalea sp. LPB0316]
MPIQILPARLANQIAAGEVVERPASVVKELVENSLDAGATKIRIDIEKGGAKRIRIVDNGKGIVKDELTLALSRHATSKIKDLDDLEAIASLGFRGEALASISSVARLTLTSKPQQQPQAWQARAEGRDMAVEVLPAAHPDGTTVDVVDLFFNTPARRKFLRTEKTEFTHIEEVIKRIALARFDVSFILTHNGKQVKHFRQCNSPETYAKRIGQVCGQPFLANAIEVKTEHCDLTLWGWIGLPSFARNQNDLCYSYVNGRMMRDKLINHAIKQAYSEYLGSEQYPAFVLFLELDHREVDVNVHPAKHEVRFHQGRYIHDFIFSVCHQAIANANEPALADVEYGHEAPSEANSSMVSSANVSTRDYVTPLTSASNQQAYQSSTSFDGRRQYSSNQVSSTASANYQQLMTPHPSHQETQRQTDNVVSAAELLAIVEGKYGVFVEQQQLRVFDAAKLAKSSYLMLLKEKWQTGLVSQPLLLPIKVNIDQNHHSLLEEFSELFKRSGIVISYSQGVVVRQFPALFRTLDINDFIQQAMSFLAKLTDVQRQPETISDYWLDFLAGYLLPQPIDLAGYLPVWRQIQSQQQEFNQYITLNSAIVDLTSSVSQLKM